MTRWIYSNNVREYHLECRLKEVMHIKAIRWHVCALFTSSSTQFIYDVQEMATGIAALVEQYFTLAERGCEGITGRY